MIQRLVALTGLAITAPGFAVAQCSAPTISIIEPAAPSAYERPNRPACIDSGTCEQWQIDTFVADVQGYIRRLETYAHDVQGFVREAEDYVSDAMTFAECERQLVLDQVR